LEVQKKFTKINLVVIIPLLALSAGACNSPRPVVVETEDLPRDELNEAVAPQVVLTVEEVQPTVAQEEIPSDPAMKRYSFGQLGISLEVPAELYVQMDPIVNYDDASKLDGYLLHSKLWLPGWSKFR
jgi:hypothetical protein